MAAFPRATVLLAVLVITCTGASTPSEGASSTAPSSGGDAMRTPVDPRYQVELTSDGHGRTWRGRLTVTFENGRPEPLRRIWFRLWGNGSDGCASQAVEVTDVVGGLAGPLRVGCTALPVVLDGPVDSGARATVSMRVRLRLPMRNDRFGIAQGMALAGNALPVLAVSDDRGWQLEPFVPFGESFYSVVGDYRVRLRTPAGLGVATTGTAISTADVGGVRTTVFAADRVRDFAWAASPTFASVSRPVAGTRVRVWYRPELYPPAEAHRSLAHAADGMRRFVAAFGPYPYPEVDVILAAFEGYGGMEYPQIVFTDPPRTTVLHELAHQWWYGLVGNDEYAEPWLDEGFATWSQFLPGNPPFCDGFEFRRPSDRLDAGMGYWVRHRDTYGRTVYGGGACMLAALDAQLGHQVFLDLLRDYAIANRFGVVRGEDFFSAVERVAAERSPDLDLGAFWRQWRVG
jgi:hypothetical protein